MMASETATLKVGDKAPDFTLRGINRSEFRLNEWVGQKNLVLAFMPAAWTPV